MTTSSEQPPPSRLASLSLGTGLFRQYRPSDTDQVSKPGFLEISNHARIGPIPRVISLQGLQIPIQKHRQRDLADRPRAATDAPAEPVLVTPGPKRDSDLPAISAASFRLMHSRLSKGERIFLSFAKAALNGVTLALVKFRLVSGAMRTSGNCNSGR